jgi:hypothetical protein
MENNTLVMVAYNLSWTNVPNATIVRNEFGII